MKPSPRVLLKGHYDEVPEKKVTIISHEDQPLTIDGITSTIDKHITYTLETVEKGKTYTLSIKTPSGLRGSFQGKITLNTSSKRKPVIVLAVTGKMEKGVKVTPPYHFFGIIDTSKKDVDPKSLSRTVEIKTVHGGVLTVEKIESGTKWVSAKTEQKKGESCIITITLDKDTISKGN